MPVSNKNFIHWLFTEHYFKSKIGFLKFIATIYAIMQPIMFTQPIWEEYQCCISLFPVICAHIVMWGFLIGLIEHSYSLYNPGWWRKRILKK